MKLYDLFETEDSLINSLMQEYETKSDLSTQQELTWSEDNGKVDWGSKIVISNNVVTNGVFIVPSSTAPRIDLYSADLSSFKNFPKTLGNFTTHGWSSDVVFFSGIINKKLTSLEYFPEEIVGIVNMIGLHNMNYTKANKYIKSIKGNLHINAVYEGPLLSLLLIDNLNRVVSSAGDCDCDEAAKIISAHINSDKDILDCQEELITNGYKEYAKL